MPAWQQLPRSSALAQQAPVWQREEIIECVMRPFLRVSLPAPWMEVGTNGKLLLTVVQ